MKVTLEFNLPEEAADHRLAMDAGAWKAVVEDVLNWFRQELKHGDPNAKYKTQEKAMEAARQAIWDACHNNGVDAP